MAPYFSFLKVFIHVLISNQFLLDFFPNVRGARSVHFCFYCLTRGAEAAHVLSYPLGVVDS